jgi:hypothetical protein
MYWGCIPWINYKVYTCRVGGLDSVLIENEGTFNSNQMHVLVTKKKKTGIFHCYAEI